jgi:hypothetical protein
MVSHLPTICEDHEEDFGFEGEAVVVVEVAIHR